MTGKQYLLVDAEARAKLLREGELSDLGPSPSKIHVTVNGHSQPICWGARQLQVGTSSEWLYGSKGSGTLKDRRTFRAQDLGSFHGAPTEDDFEEDNKIYLKEHGSEAHELHRREGALFSVWRNEGALELRKLIQARERPPPTPPPPKCSRKASSPDSVLYPPDSPPLSSLRGAASKTTKNRRPSSGPRKTHGYSLHTAGISLPLEDPPSLPNGTTACTPTPLEGIARAH